MWIWSDSGHAGGRLRWAGSRLRVDVFVYRDRLWAALVFGELWWRIDGGDA